MNLFRHLPRTWTERVATLAAATTLLFAGCSALAAFQAAGYSASALKAESELVNTWSYYQAKSVKEHLFRLRLDALAHVPPSPTADEQKTHYTAEVTRYEGEKNRLMQKAADLTAARTSAESRCALIGRALLFLQLGILLSSLATIEKNPFYWYGAVLGGTVGLGAFALAAWG